MARSVLDVPTLNSTSRLLASLDLNDEHKTRERRLSLDLGLGFHYSQNMDDLDIDHVMDVPDTPERQTMRKNGGESFEKHVGSSVACESESSEVSGKGVPGLLRGGGRLIAENVNGRRSYHRSSKDFSSSDKIENGISAVFSSLDNGTFPKNSNFRNMILRQSSAQPQHLEHIHSSSHGHRGNNHLIGRAKVGGSSDAPEVSISNVRNQDGNRGKLIDLISNDKSPSCSTNLRNTRRKMTACDTNFDKGKAVSTEDPKPFSSIPDSYVLDLTVQNECSGMPERGSSASKYPAEGIKKAPIVPNGCSSSHVGRSPSKAPSNTCKGKSKLDDNASNNAGDDSQNVNGIGLSNASQSKTKQIILIPPQSTSSPRRAGQKRLVRNGCISPYNIARAKQTAESLGMSSGGAKQDYIREAVSGGGTSSCQIPIAISSSEGNHTDRKKGKGLMNDRIPEKVNSDKGIHFPSSLIYPVEEATSNEATAGDISQCFEDTGGWRSTHNSSRRTSSPLIGEVGHLPGGGQRHKNRTESINCMNVVNSSPETDFVDVGDPGSIQHRPTQHLAQTSSNVAYESHNVNGQFHRTNKLMKRQKKHGSSGNTGDCSTSTFDDSEVAYLWSSREPPNTRTARSQNPHCHGTSGPIIEIDDLSPEMRCNNPQDTSRIVDDDSDARARQVEADEILARQLQEQFYRELPGAGDGEIDASIAWTLQQEEDTQHASFRTHRRSSHPRDSSMSHLYRQYPSRSFQNSSTRSANRGRVPTSARMARLRSSFLGQSHTVSSRERIIEFPSNMDFDTRIHILEVLEARVGNSNDMGVASHFLQVQRDFNENDYEMLLALDENNHQHGGASLSQITGLPQSTVQTDNLEEACAICLETPKTGDKIRYLPCLHKFHKDCIDPWLRRKTLCPVCKSSIT
ncbi:PREDICTED: uncharacterized protein LOC104587902 isoform X2 [Nelumbo nucifera]|uniref:Uncharacterized protein LOC104587902 isoform X2 n=1 Tax=Nelumbo nucifera TaxID=4432 RepID=A0A1U7ZA10_NELNU|nr:PREDICTED: uncharacterized protein LOC104587902 isoform X2 [Nelumbo nucifera]